MGACAGAPCGSSNSSRRRQNKTENAVHTHPPPMRSETTRKIESHIGQTFPHPLNPMEMINMNQEYQRVPQNEDRSLQRNSIIAVDQPPNQQSQQNAQSNAREENATGNQSIEVNLQFLSNYIGLYDLIRQRYPQMDQNQSIIVFMHVLNQLLNQQPQGFDDQQIANIPTFQAGNSNYSCAICQDDIKIGQNMVGLSCSHPFHLDCLKPWLKKAKNCPLCREQVRL